MFLREAIKSKEVLRKKLEKDVQEYLKIKNIELKCNPYKKLTVQDVKETYSDEKLKKSYLEHIHNDVETAGRYNNELV